MHHLITGAAGFIGSHLILRLLSDGHQVSALDDFSLGRQSNLRGADKHPAFRIWEVDLRDQSATSNAFRVAGKWAGASPQIVWHLAANSDIPAGVNDPEVDFGRTFLTTKSVLTAMTDTCCLRLAFASTSAVYGEHPNLLGEGSGPCLPASNYGAAKLASEAFISAAAESRLERTWVFRFPNVVGRHATHGIIYDLIGRLKTKPESLRVLGDGTQAKPYIHVDELIEAMQFIVQNTSQSRNLYNIGPTGQSTTVRFIAESVIARVCKSNPIPIAYTGGDRGWTGDIPKFLFSTDRLAQLGWMPKLTSNEAILKAVDEIAGEMLDVEFASSEEGQAS